MNTTLTKTDAPQAVFTAILLRSASDVQHPLLQPVANIITRKLEDKENGVIHTYVNDLSLAVILLKEAGDKPLFELLEEARCRGGNLTKKINSERSSDVQILRAGMSVRKEELLAFTEGILLRNYQFLHYKKEGKQNTLQNISVNDTAVTQEELDELKNVAAANYLAKDLANEPVNALNSVQLGEKVIALAKELNFNAEVLDKNKITELKMGGLLGVNLGSSVPPTFSVLSYKPEGAVNTRPLVIIGKGVTYDTGGYSLKPAQSMATMKSDMSGAAAVIGTFCAVVKNKLPIYMIGLIPSTDNRVSSDALVPDDIITMSDGTTVEVLNTDAEGRLILGDALHYAKQYAPELVIDLATLTGAAAAITGPLGTALMGTDTKYRNLLIESGNDNYERLAEIPYWKEYSDMLKSDVADLKNIGGSVGGSATAGKFLEHFTDYAWLHLDIAGPAFLKDEEAYKQKGATGVGVRMLYSFAKKFIAAQG